VAEPVTTEAPARTEPLLDATTLDAVPAAQAAPVATPIQPVLPGVQAEAVKAVAKVAPKVDIDRIKAEAAAGEREKVMAELRAAGLPVDKPAEAVAKLKAAEEAERARMSETERLRADLVKLEAEKVELKAKAEQADAKAAEQERRRRLLETERRISDAFARAGVDPARLDFALLRYQQHVKATPAEGRQAPEQFAAELKKTEPFLFVGAGQPQPVRPSTAPEGTAVPPDAKPAATAQGSVDEMSDRDFNKRTEQMYGFRPSMN